MRASLDFSRQNGVKCKLSKFITSSQRHTGSRKQCFHQQKHRHNDQFGLNSSELILSMFKFKTMFKQHVNLQIPVSFI